MTAYRIAKFELHHFHSEPYIKVFIVDDVKSTPEAEFTVPSIHLVEALIEVGSLYDIHPYNITDLIPKEITGNDVRPVHITFPTIKYALQSGDGSPDRYSASAKNGDTGDFEHGFGRSVGLAIVDLAKNHGFKSKFADGQTLSLAQWFQDFDYGFDRASDDQLRLEMEGIVAPDKGSW